MAPDLRNGRNLVVFLDGTRNEPERGSTNVVRLFRIAQHDPGQLVYYDPGVGTMGDRSAITPLAKRATQIEGLVIGHGIKDNIQEAYTWLMNTFRAGDRVLLFGFSRGAYTALALGGMMRTVGLLHPGAENLVPYAMKMYAQAGPGAATSESQATPGEKPALSPAEQAFWAARDDFTSTFGNPDYPSRWAKQVHFLGLWDTVKSVGWFNWRAQYVQARWPFTRRITWVRDARLAMAIDERRRPYHEYRFDPTTVAGSHGRLKEMWFAGVHSDVGGVFPDDHELSDIALGWMTGEAAAAGLRINEQAYREALGVDYGTPLPADLAEGTLHRNGWPWWFAGGGWHHRTIQPGDLVHPSVYARMQAMSSGKDAYRPHVPPEPAPAVTSRSSGANT